MIKKPYLEHSNHEDSTESTLAKTLKVGGGLAVAGAGAKYALDKVKIKMDPTRLRYLHEGLSTAENPWWKVAGLAQDADGFVDVRLRDLFLEGVKRSEEYLGGIPRTFGAFGFLSRSTFTNENTTLRIVPEALSGAESHYEELLKAAGQELYPTDLIRGFQVAPFESVNDANKLSPALFRVDEAGQMIGDPLIRDVDIAVRKWAPSGVEDKYHQIIRDVDIISEMMGARRVKHENAFPFIVTKANGAIEIQGVSRQVLETISNPLHVEEFLNSHMSDKAHRAIRDSQVLSKRLAERYMKILDQPLEFIEELAFGGVDNEVGLLGKVKKSSTYNAYKNVFGAGGDYSGTTAQLWARHGKKIAVAGLMLGAAYEVGSLVSKLFTGKDVAQLGGDVVAAGERVYAGVSDLTGMTSYTKSQEEKASGSTRIMGVLAFPISGYITGHMVAGATTRMATEEGEFAWKRARQATEAIPEKLSGLGDAPGIKKYFSGPKTRGGLFGAIGMAIGGALSLPFLFGALGSNESLDEVEAKQVGDDEVAVRKGAFWEMGRSDIEGGRIEYYRPGWYARLQDDAFDDLQYGDYGDRPISRMIKSLFDPYWREKEYYFDRPYPVTGPDTSGWGPLGTLWGMTVGRILKNPAFMHEDEASITGHGGVEGGEVIQWGNNFSEAPDGDLGGLGPAEVVSPYDQSFLAGEGAYKLTEAIGLPGFAINSIKKALTGEQDWGTQAPVMSSFSEVGSIRENFWSMNLGGGYSSTESFRRLFPNERYQLQKVNPIRNTMPTWLPGAENYVDFLHGDPYAAIREGEYRLPGSGYASRFPELEDVSPEDYPVIHQYKILADVAPYSKKFREVSKEVTSLAEGGDLTEAEMDIYRGAEAQLREREFPVKFAEDDEGLIGSYWSSLKKIGRLNPVEQLLPISPVHKFAGPLDSMSEYESKVIYSTEAPDWRSPIEDFIKPAGYSIGRLLGADFVPQPVEERRELVDYFDKLEYLKEKKLEGEARGAGDGRAAFMHARRAQSTMYGADPYADLSNVIRVIPKEERAYFRHFLSLDTSSERQEVLEKSPQYMRKFYIAQWQKENYAALAARGDLSSEEEMYVKQIEAARALEGQAASEDMWNDYQSEVRSGDVRENSFANYVRGERLTRYFEDDAPLPAPPTDWIGYDPRIQIDDVKLKIVQNEGYDYHDFDLWEDDEARLRRKPYVETAVQELFEKDEASRRSLHDALTKMNMRDLDIEIVNDSSDSRRIIFDIAADRRAELGNVLENQGYRYGV